MTDTEVMTSADGTGPTVPARTGAGPGEEEVQVLDPNAWSLSWERRAAEEAERDARLPEREVGPDSWFVEAGDALAVAYCLSLVRDVDVDQAFARLGARPVAQRVLDLDDLVEEAYDHADGGQLAGAAPVGRWTLVVEPNGFSATRPERKRALSAGTTLITLYSNVNGANELTVSVDGAERLTFDRMFPAERSGPDAERYTEDLLAAGFLFDEDAAEEADVDGLRDEVACAALVERLTGVRLSVGLLAGLRWRTGIIA